MSTVGSPNAEDSCRHHEHAQTLRELTGLVTLDAVAGLVEVHDERSGAATNQFRFVGIVDPAAGY